MRRAQWVSWPAAVAVVILVLAAANISRATVQGEIGTIDSDVISRTFVLPALDARLALEVEALQAELDERRVGLSESEQQALYQEYQRQLDARQQAHVDQLLPLVRDAIAHVAEARSVRVVLERYVVLHGGLDLTDAVLEHLASDG